MTESGRTEVVAAPSMGRGDLVLFLVATGLSLRWLAIAAAAGPSSLVVWGIAALAFQVPLCLAVIELATRFPGEGGLYLWSRELFGGRAAFLTGWFYWSSNLPYLPSILYFAAGNALWIGPASWREHGSDRAYFIVFCLAVLVFATWLNVIGLRRGKWLANLGALGTWLPVLLLLGLAGLVLRQSGSATDFATADWVPSSSVRQLAFWSGLIFATSGLETITFITAELRRPRADLPVGTLLAAITIIAAYVLGTVALLILLPATSISGLQGIMQAIAAGTERAGVPWLVPILAALITLSTMGAVSAWLTTMARLPFVGGMDGYLPPSLGRMHPRYGTPSVSLWWMCGLTAVVVLLGQAGQSVKGAYDVLVAMATIAFFIPYLYAFAALVLVQRRPASASTIRVPGGPWVARAVGALGFLTTSVTIGLALIPAADEPRPWLATGKIVGLTLVLWVGGMWVSGRRRAQ